jgi:hypothetical protein
MRANAGKTGCDIENLRASRSFDQQSSGSIVEPNRPDCPLCV